MKSVLLKHILARGKYRSNYLNLTFQSWFTNSCWTVNIFSNPCLVIVHVDYCFIVDLRIIVDLCIIFYLYIIVDYYIINVFNCIIVDPYFRLSCHRDYEDSSLLHPTHPEHCLQLWPPARQPSPPSTPGQKVKHAPKTNAGENISNFAKETLAIKHTEAWPGLWSRSGSQDQTSRQEGLDFQSVS